MPVVWASALAAPLDQYHGEIACLILEPATHTEPPPGYLAGVREPATRNDTVLVFDEMITGFRWSEADAQGVYGVTPDPSTFGKALDNGDPGPWLGGRPVKPVFRRYA